MPEDEDNPWGLEPDECRNCYGSGSVLEQGCRCLSCHETCPECHGSGKREIHA